jgi:glycine/D-amino acid oxidase-like deaminating enzyme
MAGSSSFVDVAVIGAGPYGLSLAAHLGERGVEYRIFGETMGSWKSNAARHAAQILFRGILPVRSGIRVLGEELLRGNGRRSTSRRFRAAQDWLHRKVTETNGARP